MLRYHLKIASRSLRRSPVVSLLLIAGIALGICVSTSFVTLRHMYKQDPLPGKSDQVFYVRLDTWGKDTRGFLDDPEGVPNQVTYRDARGLRESPIPVRETATFITEMLVHPDAAIAPPFQSDVRLAFGDLFTMFDMPFRYGSGWTSEDDEAIERVVVLDHQTNQRVFGGDDSIGRMIRLDDAEFRIVGVLAPWRPPLRLFDLTPSATVPPEPIYIPFNHVEPMEIWLTGNNSGWKREEINSHQDYLQSERIWLQYWVELPDEASVAQYRDWVRAYIEEQRRLGRFERPTNFRLTTIPHLIDEFGLVPQGVQTMSIVSLLFLAVCSLNLVGILLGKFLSRLPEVSVRRALGASRAQIFWQHLIECELIGLIGGAAGILLSLLTLAVLGRFMDNGEALRLDGEMLLLAAFLSLFAGLVAGIYPAWRASRLTPAMQLKVQ
jgi:putative ABC transport system permease protein